MNRKRFLAYLAAAGTALLVRPTSLLGADTAATAASAEKIGPLLPWARLRFRCEGGDDDDWNGHANGDLNLIEAINRNTTINLAPNWYVADVAKLEEMTHFPFIFMHSELPPVLKEAERSNIREYLMRGGFLFAEDCVNGKHRTQGWSGYGDLFFLRMRSEFARIVPEAKLERLPDDHPVFHSVYDIRGGIPHMQGVQHGLQGLILNGRVIALLSPSDTHCGWTNGDQWFGPGATTAALRMGINMYVFAMTQSG